MNNVSKLTDEICYLYRHIRLDKNEPFYIGIGSDEKYRRAFTKDNRNTHWRNIVAKSDYEVEIMLDNLSWSEVREKEKEFIKLYGRRDLNLGPLVNLTNGGDGLLGMIFSQETIKKMRRPLSLETRLRMAKARGGFTEETIKKIRILNKQGLNSYKLSKLYKTSRQNIDKIIKYQTYKHIN